MLISFWIIFEQIKCEQTVVLQNGKAYLYSTKDIPAKTEITASREIVTESKPEPKPEPIPEPKPKRIRILKKPTHRLLPKPNPIVKSKQEKRDDKYVNKMKIRLQFIRKLFHDPTISKQLGIKINPKKLLQFLKKMI